jgi:alpha-beta hydrolase superfamily lysophospholipase
MNHQTFWLDATDHSRLFVNAWLPDGAPRAVVLLIHGMAEHGGRYGRFGQALAEAGLACYAHDQRGHGQTAAWGVLGHYADQQGWAKVLSDVAAVAQAINQRHPHTPLFVLGHSMGSYVAQAYVMHHGSSLQGAVLCGSNYRPPRFYRAARLIARLERARQGTKASSALIEGLSFGSFNKAFKPARTRFDWLSRDPAEVDAYIRDPLCGFRCSNQFWFDMLGGLQQISKPSSLAQIDANLPLLIMGGECDPVSDGKRLKDLARALTAAGQQMVKLQIYPQARHELLNEINRDEVTRDVIHWLQQALLQPRPPRAE